MNWVAILSGVAFGAAAVALYPELGWELRRLWRVQRMRRRGGWL